MNETQSINGLDVGLFINDQYVTIKKIGQGGFGTVWQAYDFSLRNFIAVKELLPEYSEPKFVEMFYKEALIAKNIIHDNVVRVQHFWRGNNGSFYITMDFVRGVDLEDIIRRCNELQIKIPWELSVLICISMLKAIDYANRVARDSITGKPFGIVYRDISPGNVLISFDGNVKLSDFGIAKTADEINEGIKQNVVTGKYPYMSPEQIRGESDVDHRSDIFSIGVVLYEMLTGKQLYSGTNPEIKEQITSHKFDTASLEGLKLPVEMGDILSKCLEKGKDVRYERAIEMYRDLRRLLKGVETEELAVDLSSFVSKVLEDKMTDSDAVVNSVKSLDRQEIKNNSAIPKIICADFIVGDDSNQQVAFIPPIPQGFPQDAAMAAAAAVAVPVQNAGMSGAGEIPVPNFQQSAQQAPPQGGQAQAEAKGKTVFEEVGDWFVNKFRELKGKIIRLIILLIFAILLFFGLDIFMQITPFGKAIFAKMYPPDVVITTIPAGATVNMKTREGAVILQNESSAMPIPLRKVPPQTYIITALKEGFRPVQRVVRIEERTSKNDRARNERIELIFDFDLSVDSDPQGADVYIDGNKFGVTPCRTSLRAGEHTVRLVLDGFEDLGSKARSREDGFANIDFSRSRQEEIFADIDKRFWETDLKNINGENVFSMKGRMFKRHKLTSVPSKMLVHIDGEAKPRGYTPLETNLTAGTYKIRFLDPDGRYGEALKEVTVTATSKPEVSVLMNKLITFRVRSAKASSESFVAKLRIDGNEFQTTREISTGKPVTIPLPSGIYKFTFTANEFEPFVRSNVDISNINSINAEMVYSKVPLNITVLRKNGDKDIPIENAFVWIDNKIAGRTNNKGVWRDVFDPGSVKGKIVATGYAEEQFSVVLAPGKGYNHKMVMVPDMPVEPITVPEAIIPPVKPEAPPKPEKPARQPKVVAPPAQKEDVQVILCPHCGYINTVPAGRKLRFCVNCAKPLK
ncbi:MAG: protein kinase [Endomicrobia bacterium]|nr:protein kinase [Endomicrobiia bacterium]MCL2506526.1 protein kinase [Endomicrobiia bacterium]